MVKNSVLLLLHPSNRHVEEQGRFKTKKYYRRVRGPVWLLVISTTRPVMLCSIKLHLIGTVLYIYIQPLLINGEKWCVTAPPSLKMTCRGTGKV